MPDFLFEIGLEEIPARMIAAAQGALLGTVEGILINNGLAFDANANKSYSTPRRLTVFIPHIPIEQEGLEETLTGPSVQVAFKGSEPTSAAHAFAKKVGVDVSQLDRVTTSKGEYVAATVYREGRSTGDLLIEQLPPALAKFYWPKNMYWRAGKPERFVRPLRWLLALLDDQIVPIEFAGTKAGNQTYGHRILHGDRPIEIASPSEYLPKLEAAFVLPEVEPRRQKIRKALDDAARTVPGIRWREDHPLVDTVTHLTEWPGVVLGSFEEEYLTLPEEVLVTVMRDHQKYFALEDTSGKLAPYFLAVLNIQPDEQGAAIIRHGNERVLRSRFKDARFFWDFDQKIPLADRVEMLKTVTFQKDIGSYFDKTQANRSLAEALAEMALEGGMTIDKEALLCAVSLAKTDLTVELVKEFTELQGIVGGRYASAQRLSDTVANAIYSQYKPESTTDSIPPTVEGQLLSLADKLTTLYLMFAVGQEPTGSKDPFALRRAGNGVIRIMAESAFSVPFVKLVVTMHYCLSKYLPPDSQPDLFSFLQERLEFYLREVRGFDYDIVASVLGHSEFSHVQDVSQRADAIAVAKYSDDFAAISAAFKRIKNILRQAAEKQTEPLATAVSESLLTDPAEKTLYAESTKLAASVEQLRSQQKYSEALEQIATLRPHVDNFFDKVMVMAPEPELRQNRLALIATVLKEFSKIADFSEIITP